MSKKSHGLTIALAVGLFVGVASSAMSLMEMGTNVSNSAEYPVEQMNMKKIYNSLSADQQDAIKQNISNHMSDYDAGEYTINIGDLSDSASFADVSPKAQFITQ